MLEPIAAVEKWILEENPDLERIDPDLDLFESGLLNSIQIIDLVEVIDKLVPSRVDINALELEDLRTLKIIEVRFFASSESPDIAGH
ncbi:phosphopantetheine-binding protein [Nocardia asteroides]|uniref:phosphopantetheine-binding protein n=1 Tax=Nocardia asteroides TaxID=1824 RepID=UPI001E4DC800|nr:phosphopantetheine-binding protein [Nocardia asteroides]UGT61032.1 phosphopantetheine-binding protein [Nocardia asteroides]